MSPSAQRLPMMAVLGLLLPSILLTMGAAPAPLQLPDVLDAVATSSHAADTAVANEAVSAAMVDRTRATWWPSVDLSGQYVMRDNPIEAQAGLFSFTTTEQNNAQYALQVRELVFDGGRRSLAEDAARRAAEAVRLGGHASIQQAQLEAVDGYLRILELKGSRRVLVRRKEALDAHLAVVRDLLNQGLTARNDVLETEVRQHRVVDQIHALDDNLSIAREDMNRRLGRDPGTPLALPDSLPPAPRLPAGRDSLQTFAHEANASLQAARARHDAGLAEVALARRAWFPSFFVGAQHAYTENSHLVHEFVNSVSAGVSWNIFDGGSRDAKVRGAEAQARLSDRDRLEAARGVSVALADAWRRWEQARRELATAQDDVAAARENLQIVSDQYREGLARSSDVLDAETLLAGRRYDVVRGHYAIYRAQAELLTIAGQDLKDFYAAGGANNEDGK